VTHRAEPTEQEFRKSKTNAAKNDKHIPETLKAASRRIGSSRQEIPD
jgi:hypothetical protein